MKYFFDYKDLDCSNLLCKRCLSAQSYLCDTWRWSQSLHHVKTRQSKRTDPGSLWRTCDVVTDFFHRNAHLTSWRSLMAYCVLSPNGEDYCQVITYWVQIWIPIGIILRGGLSHGDSTSCVKKIKPIGAIGFELHAWTDRQTDRRTHMHYPRTLSRSEGNNKNLSFGGTLPFWHHLMCAFLATVPRAHTGTVGSLKLLGVGSRTPPCTHRTPAPCTWFYLNKTIHIIIQSHLTKNNIYMFRIFCNTSSSFVKVFNFAYACVSPPCFGKQIADKLTVPEKILTSVIWVMWNKKCSRIEVENRSQVSFRDLNLNLSGMFHMDYADTFLYSHTNFACLCEGCTPNLLLLQTVHICIQSITSSRYKLDAPLLLRHNKQ